MFGRKKPQEQRQEVEASWPAWLSEAAAMREVCAVCPQCDPYTAQVMTVEACWTLAYVLEECRGAVCRGCGAERLCWVWSPQEKQEGVVGQNWGIEAPTQADRKAFEADKHGMLKAGISKYRDEERQRRHDGARMSEEGACSRE